MVDRFFPPNVSIKRTRKWATHNHWILGVFPPSDQINSGTAVDPQQDPYKLCWLVVEPYPSEKGWSSSDWIIIPTIGENKIRSNGPNHQPAYKPQLVQTNPPQMQDVKTHGSCHLHMDSQDSWMMISWMMIIPNVSMWSIIDMGISGL